MFSLPQESLQATLQQVKQAVYNHEQWHKNISRMLMCRLPSNRQDLADDAHHRCLFGQWYYDGSPPELRENIAFVAIETEHKNMHRTAARLLRTVEGGGVISTGDFDDFANALDRLRLQLNTVTREIEELLQHRDPLTGAENRIGMLTTLREMLAMVQRNVQQCCVIIADLDHFKLINDTHGHLVGDKVLVATVRYFKNNLRPYDRVFRFGGEEFLIFLPNTDLQTGLSVIERMGHGFAANPLVRDGADPISVTASFGITMLDASVTVEESIDRADQAMYTAKHAGRNCARIWEPGLAAD